MVITGEMITLFVLVIGTLFGGFAWISNKLEKIMALIAQIDKTSVSHDVCKQRRNECPCVQQMHELKAEIKEQTQRIKIK